MEKETSLQLKKIVTSFPEVRGVYDLVINNYGPTKSIGSIHIEVDDKMTAKEIHPLTRNIAIQIYQKFGIIMTVGIYASNSSDSEIVAIRNAIREELANHPTIKQMHGFYCDQEQKTISFDVIVDFEDKNSSALIEETKGNLSKQFPDYHFFVVEDKDFSD